MARNRKRAKDRRARRPQPVASRQADGRGQPSRRPEPPELTDRAPEQPTEEEIERTEQEIVPGPTSARPDELAPDPLEHAAPDVELADAQVAFGAQTPDAEFEHEEELVEEDLEEQRRRSASGAARTGPAAEPVPASGRVPTRKLARAAAGTVA